MSSLIGGCRGYRELVTSPETLGAGRSGGRRPEQHLEPSGSSRRTGEPPECSEPESAAAAAVVDVQEVTSEV